MDIEQKVRTEVIGNIAQGLMKLAGGDGAGIVDLAAGAPAAQATMVATEEAVQPDGNYMAPWLETEECTACDECVKLNPAMFAYNDNKKAYIKDAQAGPYQDLVKAAEKCTARVIHPGLPADHTEKDIEKWIKRGEKYN